MISFMDKIIYEINTFIAIMETTQQPNFFQLSLSIEELAQAFNLINCPALGHGILTTRHKNLSEELIKAYLETASHSLLARELCQFSDKGYLRLIDTLQYAIFPLVRFDYIIQINCIRDVEQTSQTLYILKNRFFTSQKIQSNVVYTIEHGKYDQLVDYLIKLFEITNNNLPTGKVYKTRWPYTLDFLVQAQALGKDTENILKLFHNASVSHEITHLLVNDLAKRTLYATIFRTNVNSDTKVTNLQDMFPAVFAFIMSPKRSWIFTFPSLVKDVIGEVQVVSRDVFIDLLKDFVQ